MSLENRTLQGALPSSLMSFLVDTNILIYHLNGVEHATLLLERLTRSEAAMSVISYMEVIEGLEARPGAMIAARHFANLAEQIRVLDFRLEDAIVAAQVRRSLREQGRNVRSRGLDLLIAATALAHDLTLVTNNPADYRDVPGLRLEAADLRV